MPQRIDFATFGDRFVRYILNPRRLAAQFANKLPPPVNGSATLALNGAVSVEYSASVRPPVVQETTTTGMYRVTLFIDLALTGRILGGITTKTYRFVCQAPFWMSVEVRQPFALFFNTYPLVESEIVVAPNGETPPGAVYDRVVAEVRKMLRGEVDKALAGTAAARLVDLMPKASGMKFAAAETDDVAETQAFFDEPRWVSESDSLAPETDATPLSAPEDFVVDAPLGALAGKYDWFGGAFIWYRVNASLLADKLNEAIAKNPIQPQTFDKGYAWGKAHAWPGKVAVKNLGQNAARDEQGLEVRLPIDMTINVCLAGVWTEAWTVQVIIPILMPVQTWDPGPVIYLAYKPVDPAAIIIKSQQLTNTGLLWGSVEPDLRARLVQELHKMLNASNAERSVSVEKEVRKQLGER